MPWISLFIDSVISECSSPQPQSPQVFRTSRECEGGRLDCGRAGVSEKKATKDHWVIASLIAKIELAQIPEVIVANDTDVCFFRSPLVKNVQSSLGQNPALSSLQVWSHSYISDSFNSLRLARLFIYYIGMHDMKNCNR